MFVSVFSFLLCKFLWIIIIIIIIIVVVVIAAYVVVVVMKGHLIIALLTLRDQTEEKKKVELWRLSYCQGQEGGIWRNVGFLKGILKTYQQ